MVTLIKLALSWLYNHATARIYSSPTPIGRHLGGHDAADWPDEYIILDVSVNGDGLAINLYRDRLLGLGVLAFGQGLAKLARTMASMSSSIASTPRRSRRRKRAWSSTCPVTSRSTPARKCWARR